MATVSCIKFLSIMLFAVSEIVVTNVASYYKLINCKRNFGLFSFILSAFLFGDKMKRILEKS